MKFDTKPIRQ